MKQKTDPVENIDDVGTTDLMSYVLAHEVIDT